jgi:hypothetical protein
VPARPSGKDMVEARYSIDKESKVVSGLLELWSERKMLNMWSEFCV